MGQAVEKRLEELEEDCPSCRSPARVYGSEKRIHNWYCLAVDGSGDSNRHESTWHFLTAGFTCRNDNPLVDNAIVVAEGMLKDTEVPKKELIRPVKTVELRSNGKGGLWQYYGTLQGGKRVDLSFMVSRPVRSIKVDKGASVKKSQLLALMQSLRGHFY